MSNAYNHVTLIGNLCNEPEFATTQNGISSIKFRIAVQRRFKDKTTGQRKADFVNIIAWRQTADFVRQYIHKGDLVVVDGEVQSRSYDAQDGTKRYVTEINAEDVRRPYQAASSGPAGNADAQTGGGSGAEGGDFVEAGEPDDLPF